MSEFAVARLHSSTSDTIIYLTHGENSQGEYKGGYWHGMRTHKTMAEATVVMGRLINPGEEHPMCSNSYWLPEEAEEVRMRVVEIPDDVVKALAHSHDLTRPLADHDRDRGAKGWHESVLSKHGHACTYLGKVASRMLDVAVRRQFGLRPIYQDPLNAHARGRFVLTSSNR